MKKVKQGGIYKKICLISLGIFIISLLTQMYISNTTALKGKDFQHLHDRKEHLEKDIALLKYEDSKLSSLEFVEQQAAHLGFVKMVEPLLSISSPALASLGIQ